jgi:hypothetical protein
VNLCHRTERCGTQKQGVAKPLLGWVEIFCEAVVALDVTITNIVVIVVGIFLIWKGVMMLNWRLNCNFLYPN